MRGIIDCPCCGSQSVDDELAYRGPYDYEGHDMRCGDCGAEWTLHYDDGGWWVQGDDDYEE